MCDEIVGLFDQKDDYLGTDEEVEEEDLDLNTADLLLNLPVHHQPTKMNFDDGVLPPEPQLGNIEYKLKLVNPTKQRFEHLVTQMKWRLREGQGEAIYEIGVSDNGALEGLTDEDMQTSLNTLTEMAEKLGASSDVLRVKRIKSGQVVVAEVLVRKVPDDQHNIEVRVAVLGE